jgi:hypothetical protein
MPRMKGIIQVKQVVLVTGYAGANTIQFTVRSVFL